MAEAMVVPTDGWVEDDEADTATPGPPEPCTARVIMLPGPRRPAAAAETAGRIPPPPVRGWDGAAGLPAGATILLSICSHTRHSAIKNNSHNISRPHLKRCRPPISRIFSLPYFIYCCFPSTPKNNVAIERRRRRCSSQNCRKRARALRKFRDTRKMSKPPYLASYQMRFAPVYGIDDSSDEDRIPRYEAAGFKKVALNR